eukprot:84217-Alexandrium_andersonii.AAC.1
MLAFAVLRLRGRVSGGQVQEHACVWAVWLPACSRLRRSRVRAGMYNTRTPPPNFSCHLLTDEAFRLHIE